MAILTSAGITFGDATTQTTAASNKNLQTLIYTSSSTWVAPAGVTQLYITCVGGGGGLGTNYGRAGGFGGYAYGSVAVSPGTTYTITVGAGGNVGVAGTAGGESWFGANSGAKLVSGTGGAGGPNSGPGNTRATSGTGTGGTVRNGNIEFIYNSQQYIASINVICGLSDRISGPTTGTAWTISSISLPGAGGISTNCGTSQFGGMGGVILFQYAG
jgi:hypothetical protein